MEIKYYVIFKGKEVMWMRKVDAMVWIKKGWTFYAATDDLEKAQEIGQIITG